MLRLLYALYSCIGKIVTLLVIATFSSSFITSIIFPLATILLFIWCETLEHNIFYLFVFYLIFFYAGSNHQKLSSYHQYEPPTFHRYVIGIVLVLLKVVMHAKYKTKLNQTGYTA